MATKNFQCFSVQIRGSLNDNSFSIPLSNKHLNLHHGKWQTCVKSVVVEFRSQTNKAISVTSDLVQQYYVSESRNEDVLTNVNLKVFKLYSKIPSQQYLLSNTTHIEVINFTANWFNVTHPSTNLSCTLKDAFGSPLESLPDHSICIEFYLRRIK